MALAGVFRILNGKIRSHVQPDYKDIKQEYYDPKLMKCVKDFLQFYEPVGPELQCYSVLWTGDPTGGNLNLRESGEHTHFHSCQYVCRGAIILSTVRRKCTCWFSVFSSQKIYLSPK